MSDFARLAAQQCPPQEALALELAVELGAGDPVAARAALDVLAACLPDGGDPLRQLDALRGLAAVRLLPRADGPLLLPQVLRRGHGHPMGVAVALTALGQRAGYDVELVGHAMKLYVGHRRLAPVAVLDPSRTDALLDPRTLGVDLTWRCAHEVSGVVLKHVSAAAERRGDLTRSLGASALLLALPVDAAAREAQEAAHERLLARLN